jgi:uncharacterized membrane protein
MRKFIEKMLIEIQKFDFKKCVKNCFEMIVARKKQIFFGLFIIALIALGSFLIERYGFGNKLNSLKGEDAGVRLIEKDQIKNENGTLVIENDGKYVQNLELTLGENSDYGVKVQYLDPKTNENIILEKSLKVNMQKHNYVFLNFLIFKIENAPTKITITSSKPEILISSTKVDNSYHFNFYRFSFVLFLFLLICIFFLSRKNIARKPENIFFAIALIFGTLLVINEPMTYISWDEFIHYQRVNEISLSKLINNGTEDVYVSTTSIPSSFSISEQSLINKYFDGVRKDSKKHKNKNFFNTSLQEMYNRVAYVPSAIVLAIGRLLHLPNSFIFMLGRWMNVLVYSTVIFFAIRRLNSGKMILAVIALFPTSVFLASNYGYDSWVTAFLMLALAHLFAELQEPEKKMTKKNAGIILGAFIIGLGPKAIYFPLMVLLFLLKKEKFATLGQYKKFIWASIFSIIFVVGSFMLPFVVAGPGKGDMRGGGEVNAPMQVKFILSQPLEYSKILFNFVADYVNPKNATGFVTFLAYLGSIKGFILVMAVLIVVVLTDKNRFDLQTSNVKIKALMIAIYLGTIALIATALYVSFTPLKSVTINGVQPRYLIPLIFPLLYVLGSGRVRNPMNKNIFNMIIFIVMAFVLLRGIWDLAVSLYY